MGNTYLKRKKMKYKNQKEAEPGQGGTREQLKFAGMVVFFGMLGVLSTVILLLIINYFINHGQ